MWGQTSSLGVKVEQLAQDGGPCQNPTTLQRSSLRWCCSTLAYVDENRIASQQEMISEINAGLEEAGYKSWQVAWGPALNADRSNQAYAARNSETGQLAVSIRGSDFSFWLNWLEDLAVLRLVPYDQFVPTASKTAQIAFGTAVGLRQVLGMQDGTKSLKLFLTAAPEGTPILITGHSLAAASPPPSHPAWRTGWAAHPAFSSIPSPRRRRATTTSLPTIMHCSPLSQDTARPSDSSIAWTWCPMLGQASTLSRQYYPPLVSYPSDINKIIDRAENAVSGKYRQLGDLAVGSAIELPARSSRRLVRSEAAWNGMLSRMRCSCGRPPNNMPARRTRCCCRRL